FWQTAMYIFYSTLLRCGLGRTGHVGSFKRAIGLTKRNDSKDHATVKLQELTTDVVGAIPLIFDLVLPLFLVTIMKM
ncbi:hypothetical protein DFH06DRAFT_1229730, partial [Mycena polygramma]